MSPHHPRSLSHALRMGAALAALTAGVGCFGALCLLAWTCPEALDRYLTRSLGSARLFRAMAASLPAAALLGAFQAYFACRLLHTRPLSPPLGVVGKLYLLAGWSVFMFAMAAQNLFFLPLVGICALIYLKYLNLIAKGLPLSPAFLIPAFVLPIVGLPMFVHQNGTSGLHDKLPFVAVSSLWLSDVLIQLRLRHWQRRGILKLDENPRFQFTLEAVLWVSLGGGAYVSLLLWLFPAPA